jgi:hypothetical protein
MSTNNANHKISSFVSDNWVWFIGGAVLIGFVILLANSNSNVPSNEDNLRNFTSALMRYQPLQKYDETERETIISCVYYSSDLMNYRYYIRQKNQEDHFISTHTYVPDEDIITSLNRFVDGDSDALLQEERNILSDSINDCVK